LKRTWYAEILKPWRPGIQVSRLPDGTGEEFRDYWVNRIPGKDVAQL
jgi:hypothetical protein